MHHVWIGADAIQYYHLKNIINKIRINKDFRFCHSSVFITIGKLGEHVLFILLHN